MYWVVAWSEARAVSYLARLTELAWKDRSNGLDQHRGVHREHDLKGALGAVVVGWSVSEQAVGRRPRSITAFCHPAYSCQLPCALRGRGPSHRSEAFKLYDA